MAIIYRKGVWGREDRKAPEAGAGLRGRGEVGKGDGGEAGGRLKRGRDLRSARRGKINKFYLNK